MNTKGNGMWGHTLRYWQLFVFWLWGFAALGGAMAVAASLFSSVVSYYVSKYTQDNLDKVVASAVAQGKVADAKIRDAENRSKDLELQVQQAKAIAATAQNDTVRLIKQFAPRQVDQLVQRDIDMVVPRTINKPIGVVVTVNDPEAMNFGREIERYLRRRGGHQVVNETVINPDFPTYNRPAPSWAPDERPDVVIIVVGPKPLGPDLTPSGSEAATSPSAPPEAR